VTVANPHQKRHRLRKLRGETAYVDASPLRIHAATLRGAGWSLRGIAAEAGISASALSRILNRPDVQAAPATIRAVLAIHPNSLPARAYKGSAEPFVPRVGTVRRLQALMFMGYSHDDLAALGLDSRNLLNQQGRWVTRRRHDAVAAVYREHAAKPGPTPRSARKARALGYVGPAAWHDIDLDAEPHTIDQDVELEDDYLDDAAIERRMGGEKSIRLTKAEAAELVRRWHAAGRPLNDCERVTGIQPWRHLDKTERSAS
jgi:lambda repressor-like predicted transcriptional regulator